MCKLCTYVFENRSAGSAKRTLPIQIRRIVVVTTIFDVRTRKGQTMALYLCLDIVNKIEYDVSEICHSSKYIILYAMLYLKCVHQGLTYQWTWRSD